MRILRVKNLRSPFYFAAFSYYMLLSEQQRCNFQGFTKSLGNSIKAAKTFSQCFYDYYAHLPAYSQENKDFYEAEKSKIHDRVARRILALSEQNRGIYLKAGQYIGNLERIMPKEYTHVLKKLQDSGPALPFEQVKIVVENDLNQRISEIFATFDEEAIAAASLAQVHRAKLKRENTEVAVKIQFPFLRTQTFYDLKVLKLLVKACNKALVWYQYKNLDLLRLFRTFEDALTTELDFTKEISNAILTKSLFSADDRVYIPEVFTRFSSGRIITMEFIENAVKINDKAAIQENLKLKPLDCAGLLIETFGRMIFEFGHIHCDAHPGNILIRKHPKNAKKPQLVLLDHGIYRTLKPEVREKFCLLWKSLMEFDHGKVHELACFFNIEEYSHFLPILFLFRTKHSRKIIGATFTEEEKKYLQEEIISFEKISYMMQAMPPDIMFILRASNLIAIHNATLGGTTRNRLKNFTALALRSIYPNKLVYFVAWVWILAKIFLFERYFSVYSKLFG